MSDLEEFIRITEDLLARIKSETDCSETIFENAEELKISISKTLNRLKNGEMVALHSVYMHFLPTSTLQLIWVDKNWESEFLDTAARVDELYSRLKPKESKRTKWDFLFH